MKIGISYDLKVETGAAGLVPPGLPDDFQEEFDSPATIEAIASVLRGLGHDVVLLGDGRELLQRLLDQPPDFVFNFAEGQGISRSREARVPAVLDMLGIPYTGSDPLTMAVTLDKDCAKRLAASAGIAVPQALVIPAGASEWKIDLPWSGLAFPVIVKPAWEGSSKGIRNKCLVKTPDDLPEVVESLRGDHRQPVMVEEYIQGDELTVGVLGNDDPQILGIMRVLPTHPVDHFIYSLEVKRDYRRQVRYECPAPLSPEDTAAVRQAALGVFRVLGCRDVSRIDFRLRDGTPYFLEVNPLPGLNPQDSDLVIMANLAGWSYSRLIETIVQAAMAREERRGARGESGVPSRPSPLISRPP
jgi:D-alanine-D-alanine ligase